MSIDGLCGRGRRFVLAGGLLLCAAASAAGDIPCRPLVARDAAWTKSTVQRVLEHDELLRQVVAVLGSPTACTGEKLVSDEPGEYGTLTLRFRGDASLAVSSLPPESSIVTLMPGGRRPGHDWLEMVKRYVAQRGVKISWVHPIAESSAGCEKRLRYESLDAGINASVSVRQDCTLRIQEISFSMAL